MNVAKLGAVLAVSVLLVPLSAAAAFLAWSETRPDAQEQLALRARPFDASRPALEQVGRRVTVTGEVMTSQTLGDEHLRAAPYLVVRKRVEVYVSEQEEVTTPIEHADGTREDRVSLEWVERWVSAASVRSGSPGTEERDAQLAVTDARIGEIRLDLQTLDLSALEPVALRPDRVTSGTLHDGWLYLQGRSDAPAIGDVRVRYEPIEPRRLATAFGVLDATDLLGRGMLREGTLAEATAGLQHEARLRSWILRVAGLLVFAWCAWMLSGPVGLLLDRGGKARGPGALAILGPALAAEAACVILANLSHSELAAVAIAVAVETGAVSLGLVVASRARG